MAWKPFFTFSLSIKNMKWQLKNAVVALSRSSNGLSPSEIPLATECTSSENENIRKFKSGDNNNWISFITPRQAICQNTGTTSCHRRRAQAHSVLFNLLHIDGLWTWNKCGDQPNPWIYSINPINLTLSTIYVCDCEQLHLHLCTISGINWYSHLTYLSYVELERNNDHH